VTKVTACFQLDARDSADFAALLEALADAAPERLRELADEVRAAAFVAESASRGADRCQGPDRH
jgi:hypothetical protein